MLISINCKECGIPHHVSFGCSNCGYEFGLFMTKETRKFKYCPMCAEPLREDEIDRENKNELC